MHVGVLTAGLGAGRARRRCSQWSPWQHGLPEECGGVEEGRVDPLDGGIEREPAETATAETVVRMGTIL